jgi:hypothetical protein
LFNWSARVRALVEEREETIAPQAVERELPIHEIRGTSGSGYYFSATDKAPRPDEDECLTEGALAVDDLLLFFTVLTNDADSSIVNDAFDVLRSARRGT